MTLFLVSLVQSLQVSLLLPVSGLYQFCTSSSNCLSDYLHRPVRHPPLRTISLKTSATISPFSFTLRNHFCQSRSWQLGIGMPSHSCPHDYVHVLFLSDLIKFLLWLDWPIEGQRRELFPDLHREASPSDGPNLGAPQTSEGAPRETECGCTHINRQLYSGAVERAQCYRGCRRQSVFYKLFSPLTRRKKKTGWDPLWNPQTKGTTFLLKNATPIRHFLANCHTEFLACRRWT